MRHARLCNQKRVESPPSVASKNKTLRKGDKIYKEVLWLKNFTVNGVDKIFQAFQALLRIHVQKTLKGKDMNFMKVVKSLNTHVSIVDKNSLH